MTTDQREVVAALSEEIARRIGEPRFNLWFARKTKFALGDNQLVVGVPNHFFQEWLQNKFADAVRAAGQHVLGEALEVRFAIDPELFQAARQAEAAVAQIGPATTVAESLDGSLGATLEAEPNHRPTNRSHRKLLKPNRRWHRLADFVVGPCNRVAHASALSIVEAPGQAANPLVIHGPVGTGKTHLLEGIYSGIRETHPDWRVCYATAEEFTNRFVQALRLGKLGSFRKSFRDCDVLLIDDLQFLARKRATQEEFLHTFDALVAAERQVAVTCDCHPRLTDEFAPELKDRLLGGAVWSLTPPEAATRLAILQAKVLQENLTVPPAVLRFLAEQLQGNVRELEGALHCVCHYSRVVGRPVDIALAREALADLLRHAIRVVQLPDIDRAVCEVMQLPAGALQAKGKSWAVSHPRMLAIYLARKHTRAAYAEIGKYFGGRNHSTAVAAERKVREWVQAETPLTLGSRRWPIRDLVVAIERTMAK